MLNNNQSKLAFTMDTGVVGVVDLASKKAARMKVKHTNVSSVIVCAVLSSIKPNRSGGPSNLFPIGPAKS